MGRERTEDFKQDRVGTVVRELDPYRASDGMSEDNGKAAVAGAGEGSPVVVHEIPDDARGVVLDEMHAYNSTGSVGTFRVWSGTYVDPTADSPTIDTVTERSVPYSVGSAATRTIPYVGRGFEEDFIAVTASFTGEIALGVFNDHREYEEPNAEQLDSQE